MLLRAFYFAFFAVHFCFLFFALPFLRFELFYFAFFAVLFVLPFFCLVLFLQILW